MQKDDQVLILTCMSSLNASLPAVVPLGAVVPPSREVDGTGDVVAPSLCEKGSSAATDPSRLIMHRTVGMVPSLVVAACAGVVFLTAIVGVMDCRPLDDGRSICLRSMALFALPFWELPRTVGADGVSSEHVAAWLIAIDSGMLLSHKGQVT